MRLEEFKTILKNYPELNFKLENGRPIPKHFHITEVGQISKNFIDCGGTMRTENKISLQIWESVDNWHRLKSDKLLNIIELSEKKLQIGNHEIEIE